MALYSLFILMSLFNIFLIKSRQKHHLPYLIESERSTFLVGKIVFGPPNSGNLVDRMSGKFQMLNVKTYIGMWNDFGNLTHWRHSHGYRVNENDLQDFQEPDYRQSLTISFSGQTWLNSPYNSLTHVSGQLWEDLERKLPPFGHPQSGIIR